MGYLWPGASPFLAAFYSCVDCVLAYSLHSVRLPCSGSIGIKEGSLPPQFAFSATSFDLCVLSWSCPRSRLQPNPFGFFFFFSKRVFASHLLFAILLFFSPDDTTPFHDELCLFPPHPLTAGACCLAAPPPGLLALGGIPSTYARDPAILGGPVNRFWPPPHWGSSPSLPYAH